MSFATWAQHHRRSLLFLVLLLTIAGIFAAFKVPVALFPDVEFPRVSIMLHAGDRPAEQMVLQVTKPVEEAVRRVPGIQSIRSSSSRGSATIFINFAWGSDTTLKSLQITNAINQIITKLPLGTSFLVRKMSPALYPVLAYSLTSKTVPLTELRTIAQYQIRPLLSSIHEVAQVSVVGGERAEYHVALNTAQLAAEGLSIQDVTQALTAANVVSGVGKLEQNDKLYLLISDTRLHNQQDIENTIIRATPAGIIRLKDIAKITMGTVPQWIRVNSNGQDAVLVQVYQQPGGNSIRIAKAVKARLAVYRKRLPKGVALANWYDQSQLVSASAKSVRNAILIGVILAALVILLFLRNFKITIIAILVVPASLAITSLLLYASDMSFNIMTLGGMAAAIGLIIDDAIVMIEQIIRRLRAHPDHYHKRVMQAALEFTKPLTGSSAATTIIFIPLAFLQGVTGAFFKALSFTMASALIISYLVTWLAIPLLADRLLTMKDALQEERDRWLATCQRIYMIIMQWLLKMPALLLLGIIPLVILGIVAYYEVGSNFMPHMDEGGFNIDYKTPPGTSLTETNRLLEQVETIVRDTPGVASYSRRTGITFGGADPYSEANEGDFIVKLKAHHKRSTEQVMDDIREQVQEKVPGIHLEFGQLLEDVIGDLTAVPEPIEIKIYGENENNLVYLAKKVAKTIHTIPGVVDINNGINPAGDALMIHVNRANAAMERVDPDQVTNILTNAITGTVTTYIQQGNNQLLGIRTWVPGTLRDSTEKIENLMLRAPDGHLFPLKRVATIAVVNGQPQLTRENLKPMIAVTARISGRDTGSVVKAIKQKLNQPGFFPQINYYELGGLYHQQQIAFHDLIIVLITAFALVFSLQIYLYEQFYIAISVMCLPILAVAAVFIGLWITGIDLNIAAMMGMTMIVGIITEVAIFYFSEYQDLEKNMEHPKVLVQAGVNRMRPIVMTTIAAILALLPLALGLGQGATMEQPLAIAIISGLAVQLPLVLLVMPIIYYLLRKW